MYCLSWYLGSVVRGNMLGTSLCNSLLVLLISAWSFNLRKLLSQVVVPTLAFLHNNRLWSSLYMNSSLDTLTLTEPPNFSHTLLMLLFNNSWLFSQDSTDSSRSSVGTSLWVSYSFFFNNIELLCLLFKYGGAFFELKNEGISISVIKDNESTF